MSLARLANVHKGIKAVFFCTTFLLVGAISYLATEDLCVAVARAVVAGFVAEIIGNTCGRWVDRLYRAAHREYSKEKVREHVKELAGKGRQKREAQGAGAEPQKSAPRAENATAFQPLVENQNQSAQKAPVNSA